MGRFFALTEVTRPEDVASLLAKPEHWKPGRSAFELTTSWLRADGIPESVARTLATAEDYREAVMIEGFFERQVDLRTPGRPSQTDLLAFLRVADGHAVLAVEGKVDEPFGPIISEWNTGPGKQLRLESLCELLEIDPDDAFELRYQLFHRAASAVFEAERYDVDRAALLVHSFNSEAAGFTDYVRFAEALGVGLPEVGSMTKEKAISGVRLRLGWVRDEVSA
jgi:hypothetical protein